MAGGLRGLAKYASAPSGLRETDLAREVGVPPWKLKQLKQQVRGWTPGGLATAIKEVAQADADVKGASGDAGYALERMVLTSPRSLGPCYPEPAAGADPSATGADPSALPPLPRIPASAGPSRHWP